MHSLEYALYFIHLSLILKPWTLQVAKNYGGILAARIFVGVPEVRLLFMSIRILLANTNLWSRPRSIPALFTSSPGGTLAKYDVLVPMNPFPSDFSPMRYE